MITVITEDTESVSVKEACELIAEWVNTVSLDTIPPVRSFTGEDIFNYLPTGELFMIPYWYRMAKQWKNK